MPVWVSFRRIDQPCPRGWWGHPTCGPCNCDVSKGFDPDCNKTSGECHCKVTVPNKPLIWPPWPLSCHFWPYRESSRNGPSYRELRALCLCRVWHGSVCLSSLSGYRGLRTNIESVSPRIAIWAVRSLFRMSGFSVISSTPRHYLLLRMLTPMPTRTWVGRTLSGKVTA